MAEEEKEILIYDPFTGKPRKFGEMPVPNPLTITVTGAPSAMDMATKRQRVVEATGRESYLAGIQKPKRSPMGAAASDAAQKRYETEMHKPEVLSRRQAALRNVTDSDWLAMVEATGAEAYVARTKATAAKFEKFAIKFAPEIARIRAAADAMPNDTLSARIAKSAYVINQLAALKGKV